MKIIYMGTPDFAVGPLQTMINAGHEILLVVTQPDKAQGRSGERKPSPVKKCAVELGIPVFQPMKISAPESLEELEKYQADIIVVAAFGQLLSKNILQMPRYGCINIHASLLPKYRGAAPIQWAILDGEKETGITIMQMDAGLDTGDILTQKVVAIEKNDTGASLFEKMCLAGSELLISTLQKIQEGTISGVPQDSSQSSYAKMLKKEMGLINWSEDAVKIERWVRGLNSWPSAYTKLSGKNMKIWQSELAEAAVLSENIALQAAANYQPGEVVMVERDSIYVQTGKGLLRILEIQMEGKKRMGMKQFMLGHPFTAGMVLGE